MSRGKYSRWCVSQWFYLTLVGILICLGVSPSTGWSQSADKAAQKATEKIMERTAEKAADKAAEKAVEQTVEKVAGSVVQKAAEQAAVAAVAKAELTAKRPVEWQGPTEVKFLVLIVDIDSIDDADQSFAANVYIRLRWHDQRLANPGSEIRQMPLASIWNPQVLLANQTGLIPKSLPDVVQVDDDGTVTYQQRYTGQLSQRLNLSNFPRDKHDFVVQFVAAGFSDEHIKFVPDEHPAIPDLRGGGISKNLSLPDWEVVNFEAAEMTYRPIEGVHAAGFGLRFEADRYLTYYLWQMVLPLVVVVMMSWAAFWVSTEKVEIRLGVATSAVLTLIANRFVFATLLPHLPYMTRMDYLSVGSTLLVLMSLFMVVLCGYLESRQKRRLTEALNLWSRGVFPGAFLILLGWFLFA